MQISIYMFETNHNLNPKDFFHKDQETLLYSIFILLQ